MISGSVAVAVLTVDSQAAQREGEVYEDIEAGR
jgi:hypothetical protein